jgi:hypothetical protein
MLFGHNTNVSVGESLFHVQTEDRGVSQALIDTTVYFRGRVLHRRTNNYLDLVPLDRDKEAILKQRLDEQHRSVEEDLRSGALKLMLPHANPSQQLPDLKIELMNAGKWLNGKRASLQIAVQDRAGNPAANANILARMEGTAQRVEISGTSGDDGRALMEFDMPPLAGAEAALVVEADNGSARGLLRFQMRARPKVPAV